MASDDLNVDEERVVYESVMKWVNYNPDKRKSYLPNVRNNKFLQISLKTSYLKIIAVNSNVIITSNTAPVPCEIPFDPCHLSARDCGQREGDISRMNEDYKMSQFLFNLMTICCSILQPKPTVIIR